MLFMIQVRKRLFGEIDYLKNLTFLLLVKFLLDYGIFNLISPKLIDLMKAYVCFDIMGTLKLHMHEMLSPSKVFCISL